MGWNGWFKGLQCQTEQQRHFPTDDKDSFIPQVSTGYFSAPENPVMDKIKGLHFAL